MAKVNTRIDMRIDMSKIKLSRTKKLHRTPSIKKKKKNNNLTAMSSLTELESLSNMLEEDDSHCKDSSEPAYI